MIIKKKIDVGHILHLKFKNVKFVTILHKTVYKQIKYLYIKIYTLSTNLWIIQIYITL